MKTILIALLALCLTGCATGSNRSVVIKPLPPVISAEIMAQCDGPASIPANAGLSAQWTIWAKDRSALVECSRLNAAKAQIITEITKDKP